jgi:hypothetical protein
MARRRFPVACVIDLTISLALTALRQGAQRSTGGRADIQQGKQLAHTNKEKIERVFQFHLHTILIVASLRRKPT